MAQDDSVDASDDFHAAPTPRPILKIEKIFLGIALFATLFLVLMSSVWTQSSVLNTFLGFLPLLITIVLLLFLREENFKDFVYWAIPFVLGFVFLAFGSILNVLVEYQLDVGALTVINIFLGLVVVFAMFLFQGKELIPRAADKPESIEAYLHSIQDKCKALNFVIGRVYRGSNGGTNNLRAKLRIESDWYNAFEEITDMKKEKQDALSLLHKIHDRLLLLTKEEKVVFSATELKNLKNIQRDVSGKNVLIDVLVANDRDPVEMYYVSAVDATRKLLSEVEKL